MSTDVTWSKPQVRQSLAAVRRSAPLVHLYTNPVALALSANLLAAVGAVPAARAVVEEPDPGSDTPDATLVNLGVRGPASPDLWQAAAEHAAAHHVPWVLDPIGANGPYPQGRRIASELLRRRPAVVRGNGSEVVALAGGDRSGRGPDSACTAEQALPWARTLAAEHGTVVVVSGPVDVVTDGSRVVHVPGGHPWMPRVSALGCAHGALVAAFVGTLTDPFEAAVAACAVLAAAGDRAARLAAGPGTLVPHLVDVLSALTD